MLSSVAFESIDRLAGTDSTAVWAEEEEYAIREHGRDVTVMDIYDIRMEKHKFNHSNLLSCDNWLQSLLRQIYFLN